MSTNMTDHLSYYAWCLFRLLRQRRPTHTFAWGNDWHTSFVLFVYIYIYIHMTDCIFTVTGTTMRTICSREVCYWQTSKNDNAHLRITFSKDNVGLKVSASRILTCRRTYIDALGIPEYAGKIVDKNTIHGWRLLIERIEYVSSCRICYSLAEINLLGWNQRIFDTRYYE